VEQAALIAGEDVLDLACGTGDLKQPRRRVNADDPGAKGSSQ